MQDADAHFHPARIISCLITWSSAPFQFLTLFYSEIFVLFIIIIIIISFYFIEPLVFEICTRRNVFHKQMRRHDSV